jgi:hypothetical protein
MFLPSRLLYLCHAFAKVREHGGILIKPLIMMYIEVIPTMLNLAAW